MKLDEFVQKIDKKRYEQQKVASFLKKGDMTSYLFIKVKNLNGLRIMRSSYMMAT